MTSQEFSLLYPLAKEKLVVPGDQFDQQYYRFSPTNVNISATITTEANAVLYVWSDIKKHWTLLRKKSGTNQGMGLFTN